MASDPFIDKPDNHQIQVRSTPPPQSETTAEHEKALLSSPPALSSSMTPPPSVQHVGLSSPVTRAATTDISLSPTSFRLYASRNLPSSETINNSNLDQLRSICEDLVRSLTDAKISAAHLQLQNQLLSMGSAEAAQRNEVEQAMMRQEVDALQAASDTSRNKVLRTPRASIQPVDNQVDKLTKTCKILESEREEIEFRWEETKRQLEMERERSERLAEKNELLMKRILEKKDYFRRLQANSPTFLTPREAFTTPRRRHYARYADDTPTHAPFAALIAADQILSQETNSVPSTPTKSGGTRFKTGHNRGAHSLSSLNTPQAGRPGTSDGFLTQITMSAPGSQLINESAERERLDRDSTISMSDTEDIVVDDIPASQASSLATDMLRRNPLSQESLRQSQDAERSSNRLQSKLFGPVKKVSTPSKNKRTNDFEFESPTKKARRGVEGLGIGVDA